jgi:hypothetical protein
MSDTITPTRRRGPLILIISLVVLAAIAAGAAMYASPYLMPRAIKQAGLAGDREKLERLIDFPRVREGLKSDLNAVMGEAMKSEMAKPEVADNPFAQLLAPLAKGLVSNLVDGVVDEVVSPAGIERIVAQRPETDAAPSAAPEPGRPGGPVGKLVPRDASGDGYKVDGRYLAFDRFQYVAVDKDEDARFVIDMRRRGLFGWQVSRVSVKVDPKTLQPNS